MIVRHLLIIASAAIVWSAPAIAADTHPFGVGDLVRLNRLSEPALSPDGRHIVYTQRQTDLEADRDRADLWLLDVTQSKAVPKRLTSHPENDFSPQWSRVSGNIYFLSARSGSQQVWRLSLTGGEAQQVTKFPLDVTTYKLAPDDSYLAVTLDVFPDCGDLACTAKRFKQQSDHKSRGMVFDRIFVRHWDTWDDGTQTHLFVAKLQDGVVATEPRDLSGSLDADVPSKPFGDASEYNFTPDSSKIVFDARIKGKSEPWSTNFDLYEVSVAGGAPKNLTQDNPAWDAGPIFSGDGHWMAYRAMERPSLEADRFHIELVNRKTGERRALTKDWDRSVDTMEFARWQEHLCAHGSFWSARTVVRRSQIRQTEIAGEQRSHRSDYRRSQHDLFQRGEFEFAGRSIFRCRQRRQTAAALAAQRR